jgi:acyl carrier protein phosphodiesterase
MTEEPLDEYASKVRTGIEKILQASPALLSDFNYALLCSKILSEAVAFVIVGTELLKQARVDARRLDLAASWIDQRMPEVEMHARRISEGNVSSIERCERILALQGEG